MNGLTVVMSSNQVHFLKTALFTTDGLENAAFALCGFSRTTKETRLLVRKIIEVPLEAYIIRTEYHLEVSPSFINSVIDASGGKLAILTMHSHPGKSYARYSPSDDYGESRLLTVFTDLLPDTPHASLLFAQRSVIGRYWAKSRFRAIDRIRMVGSMFEDLTKTASTPLTAQESSLYDRQVMAFGPDTQTRIRETQIGIVGVGGTGSAVAEQLARLGVKNLILVDPDNFESSNLTRMYGTFHSDAQSREPKVNLIRNHVKRINSAAEIVSLKESVISQKTLLKLKSCDTVFCCTDNDWSRSVLNRFAYQYFVPVIDMGVRIVVDGKKVEGAGGRVSMIGPGLPCLWCTHHLSSDRIRVESMDSAERKKLEKEKYVTGLAVKAPSVISLNSTLAGLGVTLWLSALAGFAQVTSHATDQIYDAIEGIVFRSRGMSDPECKVCGPDGITGLGDLQVVSAYE